MADSCCGDTRGTLTGICPVNVPRGAVRGRIGGGRPHRAHRLPATVGRGAAGAAVATEATGAAPSEGPLRPRAARARILSQSLTSGGGGLAAMPSGCLIAVTVSATPATNSWYLPTPKALSIAVTIRPVLDISTPATTAPAIRPTPAT